MRTTLVLSLLGLSPPRATDCCGGKSSRTRDGANWPRRFRTTVDGQSYEDLRLRDYHINPTIDPKVFAPGGR
jgi:hypothetical protein